MRNWRCVLTHTAASFALLILAALPCGCSGDRPDGNTAVMLIESSPANLDPRIGTDAQSERIDMLIFDALLRKDAHFNVTPWLAQSWEHPDPLTYIFHLRSGVRFHDGRPLTSSDVKWTIDSMRDGSLITSKSGAYKKITRVDATDPATCVVHLKAPDNFLLYNLSDGAIGIVPAGSGKEFWRHPVGSGPFRFVSQEQDRDVVLRSNDHSWQPPVHIAEVRFHVVPDAITRALELQKGSADVAINALTPDMVQSLREHSKLVIQTSSGTIVHYMTFNLRDLYLSDVRVRQAIAYAIDRPLIVRSLWRDQAQLASSLLPPGHWARAQDLPVYSFDPAKANALLDAAGYKRGAGGIRFHLEMKISTSEETTRLMALVMQQQLRRVGIVLDVRSFEFATFYADITKGAFSVYALRWIGGNESPDIFRYAYATEALPPHGANRGFFRNAALDREIAEAAVAPDLSTQRADYIAVQQLVAEQLPSLSLWYLDNVLVHTPRMGNVQVSPSGNYDFLRDATITKTH